MTYENFNGTGFCVDSFVVEVNEENTDAEKPDVEKATDGGYHSGKDLLDGEIQRQEGNDYTGEGVFNDYNSFQINF
ncbi:MAG: hypothetical protein OXR68_06380 [Alphaproteobacteria bacterium]|nr:hypothetical protein [Alphaproteobacteria bacterium]MDD9920232.1 hypothetical protein [Alphaproteobacteria bacterium]